MTPPLLSILLPIVGSVEDPLAFRRCLESIAAQTSVDFELCITVNGKPDRSFTTLLPEPSNRIRIHRRTAPMGRAASLDDALRVASGRYVAPVEWCDQLAPTTVAVLSHELSGAEDIDLLFTDEDVLDLDQRTRPFYKPGFSPDRFRQQMYLGGLVVCRRSLATEIGGFADLIAGAEEYDFALRVSEQARRIVHVPQVLYHRGRTSSHSSKAPEHVLGMAQPVDAQVQAVEGHLRRTGFPARAVANIQDRTVVDLEPVLSHQSTVSIVIPTGGVHGPVRGTDSLLVVNAISSLVSRTTYRNYELVVVLDQSASEELANQIRRVAGDQPITLVHDKRPFNFSKACNLGAVRASGDVLIFLNDDTEVRTYNWIERLTMFATRHDVGAVGAKLLYEDERIQQIGIWSRHGHPLHRYVGYRFDHPGNRSSLRVAQNCLAVTAACLAVEKEKFLAVGGFTPIFPLSFNDVDLCLKLGRHGFHTVVDGATTLYHFESMSRDPSSSQAELEAMHRRWEIVLRADPYDNPNHRTEGVEELPLPSDSFASFENGSTPYYLGRHYPPLKKVLQC